MPAYDHHYLRPSSGGGRSSTRTEPRTSNANHGQNRQVMDVHPAPAADVFGKHYHAWPSGSDEYRETTVIYWLSENFDIQHSSPFETQLTSRQERFRAFTFYPGHYPECHGTHHSMRHCLQRFTNCGAEA